MAYYPNNPNGQATSANSLPVVIASDQSAVTIQDGGNTITVDGTVGVSGTVSVSGTVTATPTGTQDVNLTNASIPVTDNGGSLTVDGTIAATQSGSWNVGINAGTNAIGSITNTSFIATQSTAANLNATVVGTGTFAVQADTELPTAAALADGAANPTTPTVGAAALVYNGSTWDRAEGASGMDGNGATTYSGVLAVKNVGKRLNPAALGTATNSAVTVDVFNANNVTVSIATTTTGTFVIEGTGDNTNWSTVEVFDVFADLWVSGQSITPTAGKVYSILSGGLRQVRIRTNATLGATVTNLWVLDNSQEFIGGIDTGAAPHNFGYALVHKDGEYSTTQTTTALWTPTTGKRFVVTDLSIATGGTTAGIVTIFDSAAATAYSVGTTPAIFRGEFAPSANAKPGMIKSFNVPYYSAAVNNRVHVTTSAAMTIYVQLNGYEI